MRKVVGEMLEEESGIKVIEKARNGRDALLKVEKYDPDVITLDVEMPKMDGLEFLQRLMEKKSTPVIMLSSLTGKQSETTIKALELGAFDFVLKPSGSISLDIEKVQEELITKVKLAAKVKNKESNNKTRKLFKTIDDKRVKSKRKEIKSISKSANSTPLNKKLLVIGASTGGPRAIKDVVTLLPKDINADIIIVQHMPAGFTTSLAERLDGLSHIKVKEAQEGDRLEKGKALLAPGGYHMLVKRGKVTLSKEDKVHNVRPAIDVTIKSIIEEYGSNTVGVLLTGMGKDGAEGLKMIKGAGGQTIAQDEDTSVVYGMPKVAYNIGAVDVVKPIGSIAKEIIRMLKS
ncbi:protein-glutamate methylesterase/protein-glutamine glutaminase [Halonatronum saccharophilum]|uniref:protein-glutamate methylesterase/protein-glutamine glutaminase n=1 Tax=Halonatronum saccharophilum TaxID=150060 RepID=UPI0006864AE6